MNNFVIEEYKALVAEMQTLMTEARQLELYCAGAVAAMYAWFITAKVSIDLAWFLPIIIPVLGLLRSWAYYERVKQIAAYVQKLESFSLANDSGVEGWENNYKKIRAHGLTPTGMIFWALLVVLCLIAPFLFGGNQA